MPRDGLDSVGDGDPQRLVERKQRPHLLLQPVAVFSPELTQGMGRTRTCTAAPASGTKTASTTIMIATSCRTQRQRTAALARSAPTWKISALDPTRPRRVVR